MGDTRQEASRFLMQATLGADHETIEKVSRQGTTSWLDEQLDTGLKNNDRYLKKTSEIWQSFRKKLVKAHGVKALDGDGNNPALPYQWYFRMAWWDKNLSSDTENLLRHRVALALSEILVISENSQLELDAEGLASYYDILYTNAFGSYKDMLYDVSMHPTMGVYLSHLNNRKADPSKNIHPDENYAREIMQLFSIGLFELNMDGTRKKDANGNDIPTYDNRDIKEMARIFTGLKASQYLYEWDTGFFPFSGDNISFSDGVSKTYKSIPFVDMVNPMVIDDKYHDTGAKKLLGGRINLKARQRGKKDIRMAVKALVAHPSTAPYIAHKLIQQMVTSNPSPAYVQAVASKWGPEGDMKAVIREIFTHPEAQKGKKLKSPILRVTQLMRAYNATNSSGKLWLTGDDIKEQLSQHPLAAPTVFNFYKPDYSPHGKITNKGLVAPEFELHNSSTSVSFINTMYGWFFGEYYPLVSTQISQSVNNVPELDPDTLFSNKRDALYLDFSEELVLARRKKFKDLIRRVSLTLNGTEKCDVEREIMSAISNYPTESKWVVQTVVFIVSISPQFAVLEGAA